MIIFRCDCCGHEVAGGFRNGDAALRNPEDWILTKLKTTDKYVVKIHLCSFKCVKEFNADRYLETWRLRNRPEPSEREARQEVH